MVELVLVGVVAGFLAGISPCILPVLPPVPGGVGHERDAPAAGRAGRPGLRLHLRLSPLGHAA